MPESPGRVLGRSEETGIASSLLRLRLTEKRNLWRKTPDAAPNDAALNGFTDGTNGVTVALNNPPASGTFAGADTAASGDYFAYLSDFILCESWGPTA